MHAAQQLSTVLARSKLLPLAADAATVQGGRPDLVMRMLVFTMLFHVFEFITLASVMRMLVFTWLFMFLISSQSRV